jgi:ribosomal protein S18 acetylase RimI-like enzyme
VFALRAATLDDLATLLPRTRDLNAHEGIAIDAPALEAALERLLRDPSLGGVWLIDERSEIAGGAAGGLPRGIDERSEIAKGRIDERSEIAGGGIERERAAIGYAIVTFGYDLEFGGRDAFLTELWVDPVQRGRGAGGAALDLLGPELRALGVRALHLQVRPENPALRLYARHGFVASPRVTMTQRL